MRVKKAYLKSERVQTPATRLKSERVQSEATIVARAGEPVTVKIGPGRKRAGSGGTRTSFVVKIG